MSNSITSVTQAPLTPAADQTAAAGSKAPKPSPQSAPADAVNISSAAKAILQEVQETHTQTVQEANAGDSQARRLLSKESATAIPRKG
jgi:hypothetical protein